MIDDFSALIEVSEKLSRRQRLTPSPTYRVAHGLVACIVYRCVTCQVERVRQAPIVVGSRYTHERVSCLRCAKQGHENPWQTVFVRVEFRSLS